MPRFQKQNGENAYGIFKRQANVYRRRQTRLFKGFRPFGVYGTRLQFGCVLQQSVQAKIRLHADRFPQQNQTQFR